MKKLSSFIVLNVDGSDRITYAYNEIDEQTGNFISQNNKANFIVVDEALREHIEEIRDYISKKKLEG